MKRGTFAYRLGALSQLVNSLIGKGNRDQTFSARSYEASLHKKWPPIYLVIDMIFFWEDRHSYISYLTDNEFTYKD